MTIRARTGHTAALVALAAALALAACGERPPTEEDAGAAGGDEAFQDATAREHEGDRPEPSAATGPAPASEVVAEEVTYAQLDGREVQGFLARPAGAEGPLPGILVIHEWWGLNDNVRTMTRRLAGEGYAALAVDLFGGETAEDPEGARELVGAVDDERALENLRAARAHLAGVAAGGTDQEPPLGVIGWCFGGGWSLRAALEMGEAIDAAVVYYGRPVTEAEALRRLEAPLLGHFGAEDSSIPVDAVRTMESTLAEQDKDAEIHVYEGAGHAFANPSGTRYQPEAAEEAWRRTVEFFDQHLGGGSAAGDA